MKKLLILIVAAAVFLHFYPQPKLTAWYEQQMNTVMTTFNEITDTQVRLKAEKVYRQIEPKFDQFNPDEQQFVREITASRQAVKSFYFQHCDNKVPTQRLHRKNQALVCQEISTFRKYF